MSTKLSGLVSAFMLLPMLVSGRPASGQSLEPLSIRLNQIQTIGTHNSYHLAPPPEVLAAIALGSQSSADGLDYSHRPINDQLGEMKIRQLELDLYADPDGGLFSHPIAYRSNRPPPAGIQGSNAALTFREQDPNANRVLDNPGFKVLHSPDFDYRTVTPTFVDALEKIKRWSNQNPNHIPILVLVEMKDTAVGPVAVQPVKINASLMDQVDREIRSVFNDAQVLTPDRLRGVHTTLWDAIQMRGWPRLETCRGQVWFALDNTGHERTLYLNGHPNLENRVMFVSSAIGEPTAAFVKLNDPIKQYDEIVRSVKAGLIVRTRADSATIQARTNSTARREKALASGAQYISTDYPIPDTRLSTYRVQLPNRAEYRVNSLFDREE